MRRSKEYDREMDGVSGWVDAGAAGEARVTLNGRGVMHMNLKAYEALGMPAAVKLLYDEDRRVIGVSRMTRGR
jgi:hypothetical protein